MKKFIIAPDSFKGSLTCGQAALAIEKGAKRVFPDAETVCLPIADGGEGTMDVIASVVDGVIITTTVKDPLFRDIQASYFMSKDKTAVVELAKASGITLIDRSERDPFEATTFGTGQLIRDALDKGAKKIILTLGGSATNDGGIGIAMALGLTVLDEYGGVIRPNVKGLLYAKSMDANHLHEKLSEVEIVIACDVSNPLCGKEGATAIFGPQKGAKPEDVPVLDDALNNFGMLLEQISGKTLRTIPGTGAAGGAALPLLAFSGAKIVSGIHTVLDVIGFDSALEGACAVLTGEGKIDGQTCFGKAIAGVLEKAFPQKVPVIAFAGMLEKGYERLYEKGLTACFCIQKGACSLEKAMANAESGLADTVENALRIFALQS